MVKPEESENRSARVRLSQEVWDGIEAVRRSGLTNMLDRPMVAYLAQEFGYAEAGRWVEEHRNEYSAGIFRGFEVDRAEREE